LTGVFNRRHLLLLGEQALEQARRYQHPLAALMIDIDHFKQINDRYGHAVGDEALEKLAECLQNNLRAADILGRYGGEEFVVLMPETDLETARQSAERLVAHIRALTIETEHAPIPFTASIGVAVFDHARDTAINELIQRADQAMYAAKQAGRNQVFALG
jgi:diguanylate cyclase (GGDEF)-like protein